MEHEVTGALVRLKPAFKRVLPRSVWNALKAAADRLPLKGPTGNWAPHDLYERLYEQHARASSADEAVGDGSFDLIGRLSLAVLVMEGLRPADTLVDFGCGTGRLAIHAVPWMTEGHYIGIDISQSMLDRAAERIRRAVPEPSCRVSWIKQTSARFPLDDDNVDLMCAFSVFTHMEHEDSYQYLEDARRVVRPGGRFVLSCLPMDLHWAKDIFVASARVDFRTRWSRVRNVTTSRELMSSIAQLAGWDVLRWYPGDVKNIRLLDRDETWGYGQSICVLEAPHLSSRIP